MLRQPLLFSRKHHDAGPEKKRGFKAGPSGDLLNICLTQSQLVRTGAFFPPCLQNVSQQRLSTSTQEGDIRQQSTSSRQFLALLGNHYTNHTVKTETNLHFTDVVKSKAVFLKKLLKYEDFSPPPQWQIMSLKTKTKTTLDSACLPPQPLRRLTRDCSGPAWAIQWDLTSKSQNRLERWLSV